MNSVQRQRLMSNLPNDQELQDIMHSPTNTDKAIYDQLNSWVKWKIFYLIITVFFYAIYYYSKNKYQESRNIFRAISQTLKPMKYLKTEINAEKKNEKKSKKHEKDESKDDAKDESHSENTASYESPTATSQALKSKKPKVIEFDENILKCYRLRNGNFIIQYRNLDIHIIDPYGKKIKDLSPDNKSPIITFIELADGTIVAGGKTADTKLTVLYYWNDKEQVERTHQNVDRILMLDSFENTIAILTSTDGQKAVYILEVSNNEFKQVGNRINCGESTPHSLMLINKNEFILSYLKDDKHPHLVPGLLKFNFKTNTQVAIECNSHHLVRLPEHQILHTNNPSKAQIHVRQASNFKLLFEADINDHDTGFSQIATSPNGKFLVTADWNGRIILWDSESFAIIKSYDTGIYIIPYLAVSDQGEIAVTEGELEDYSTKITDNGRQTISAIHFFNRAPKPQHSLRESEEKIQDEISDQALSI